MNIEDALIAATRFFTLETLGIESELSKNDWEAAFWSASIPIGGNMRAYLYIPKPTLERMALLFLNEESPQDDVLRDLVMEVANLIVGKAKVIAQKNDLFFNISTPNFEGSDINLKRRSKHIYFKFGEDGLAISVKKRRS
ncbi:MAG: chemotaxis protein CheX [Helicobacteraceae bacterium]|jgi:hypothetical protein|nr:chemotaxis protein CheX [Helicobacteraceae bacterium]